MKKYFAFLIAYMFLVVTVAFGSESMKTENFEFEFEGKKLSGILDLPAGHEPTAIVIFVPGSGKTDTGKWLYNVRSRFVELGLACCLWDKPGCGKSEGEYDSTETVQHSAKEVLTAIEELNRSNVPGSSRIGLWGISRAGWVCPLVIAEYPSIDFWISVSGTDDKETYPYLLESNLRIEGRSEAETRLLMTEWKNGFDILRKGGTYDEYLNVIPNLRKDPFYMANNMELCPHCYKRWQKKIITGEYKVDEESGLTIYVPDFRNKLKKIKCPVLAIFGEKDANVDWRKTNSLYKETIGANKNADLTIKTFPDGNHNIQKCETGGINEMVELRGKSRPCDGYYDTMLTWLKEHGFGT